MPGLFRKRGSRKSAKKKQNQSVEPDNDNKNNNINGNATSSSNKPVEFRLSNYQVKQSSVPLSTITTDHPENVSPLKNNCNNSSPSAGTTSTASTSSSSSDNVNYSSSSSSSSSSWNGKSIPPRPHRSRWNEDDFQKVVRVWDLSQEEINTMRDLEGKLSDITHWKNSPSEVVRFMKGPAGQKGAERGFRKMVDWRLQNDIDRVLEEYTPPPILLDYCPSAVLHGLDYDGDPIYLERAGATDASGLLRRFGHDALMKHVVWLRELCGRGKWIQSHEERMGRPITQVTIVYDLAGLNTRHMSPGVLPFFSDMMSLTRKYYGAPVKRMIIIRTPAIFRYAELGLVLVYICMVRTVICAVND